MSSHLAWPGRCASAALLAVTLAATLLTSADARAAVSTAPACDNDFGTNTPVLLVHGFHEGTNVWKSMMAAIQTAVPPRVKVVPPFDYPPTQWVTDPNVGAALASVISCLATDSKTNGGPGTVIIVAHSMGGLAVRCALAPSCVGTGHQAAQDKQVGLLITMGTPNSGSLLATAGDVLSDAGGISCDVLVAVGVIPGCPDLLGWLFGANSPAAQAMEVGLNGKPSHQLAELPPLPSHVPLYAMAGQVKVTTSLFAQSQFQVSGPEFDLGDIVVSVDSALDGAPPVTPAYPGQQSTPHPGAGSGSVIMPCGTASIAFLADVTPASVLPDITCTHLTETTNAAWQAAAINAIRAYQATVPPPVVPDLYVHSGMVLGSLYKYPDYPVKIALNNGAELTGLQWANVSPDTASATGTLMINNCTPSCAGGAYVPYPVQVTASNSQDCTVALYQPYSDTPPQMVQADVFNDIAIAATSQTNQPPDLGAYDNLLSPACSAAP